MLFADIIFPLKIPHPLTYQVPDNLQDTLCVGDLVYCPLQTKTYTFGCIIKLHQQNPSFKVKKILRVADSKYRISQNLLLLTEWISRYYYQAPGLVLEHASFWGVCPPDLKWRDYLFLNSMPSDEDFSPDIIKACMELQQAQLLTKPAFLKKRGVNKNLLAEFIKMGIVSSLQLPGLLSGEEDIPLSEAPLSVSHVHKLTKKQKQLKQKFFDYRDKKKNTPFLLHGITGSGKTELYCHIIERILDEDRDIIFLVPEVSLVGQTVRYLQKRFGHLVSWYHYLRTPSDKLSVAWLIRQRKIRILVGTRSAVFAPFSNLGLIIVDEEHSGSYKSEERLTYNARDVAIYRGYLENFPVILGSATPSIEGYYQAQKGKYIYLSLAERFNLNPLPPIHIIDLQDHFRSYDPNTMISIPLKEKIVQTLEQKHQILLFLNRRGFSTFQMCLQCGNPVMCRNCCITLTYHKRHHLLKCHYCNFQRYPEKTCSHCQSEKMHYFGSGTQQVEENIRKEFPEAGVLRIDSDVIHSRKKLAETEHLIQSGKYNILIGTQMITKGLHLKKLSLVGILDVDYLLTLPDFRAAEKTFSLILQAAGRAGREDAPGQVVIQTFMKNHAVFRALENHKYEDFYQPEIKFRRSFLFPPFRRLIKVLISGKNETDVHKGCKNLSGFLEQHPDKDYHIIGPTRCPLEKIKGNYRYMFIIRYRYPSSIQKILPKILRNPANYMAVTSCKIHIDTDPLNFL